MVFENMKKIIIIFLIVILAAWGGFIVFKPKKQVVDREAVLEPKNLKMEFRETGSVNPRNRLEIKPPFAGRIEKILVNEGNQVKKGQVIIWMSSSERAAMIDMARAAGDNEYNRWETIYKPTPIVTPMNGFIILRKNEPGQSVTAADAILVMADDLIIEANIDETDLRYIQRGLEIEIYLDAYPDDKFKGIVEHIAHEASVISNVTVYTIKIKPIEKPKVFRAGMTATITIISQYKENALSIPSDFITDKGQSKTIMIKTGKKGKNAFVHREVETGVTDGKFTEIISGLTKNETAVVFKSGDKEKTRSFMRR
jgi:macrolide-specific efflux system membrane fusion protein